MSDSFQHSEHGRPTARGDFLGVVAIDRIRNETRLQLQFSQAAKGQFGRDLSLAAEALVNELQNNSPTAPKAMLNDLTIIRRGCSKLLKRLIGINPDTDLLPRNMLDHLSGMLPDYPAPALRGLVDVAGHGNRINGLKEVAHLAERIIAVRQLSEVTLEKYTQASQARNRTLPDENRAAIESLEKFVVALFKIYARSFVRKVDFSRCPSGHDGDNSVGRSALRFVTAVFQEVRHRVSNSPSLRDLTRHKALNPTRDTIDGWIRDHQSISTRP